MIFTHFSPLHFGFVSGLTTGSEKLSHWEKVFRLHAEIDFDLAKVLIEFLELEPPKFGFFEEKSVEPVLAQPLEPLHHSRHLHHLNCDCCTLLGRGLGELLGFHETGIRNRSCHLSRFQARLLLPLGYYHLQRPLVTIRLNHHHFGRFHSLLRH